MRYFFRIILLITAFALLFAVGAFAEDMAVIVNPDNNNAISMDLVRDIYKLDRTSWPDGKVVVALALPQNSDEHKAFVSKLFQGSLSLSELKSKWDEKLFSGKGKPPRELFSDDLVISIVALNKKAIGYVKASSVTSRVKTALTLP